MSDTRFAGLDVDGEAAGTPDLLTADELAALDSFALPQEKAVTSPVATKSKRGKQEAAQAGDWVITPSEPVNIMDLVAPNMETNGEGAHLLVDPGVEPEMQFILPGEDGQLVALEPDPAHANGLNGSEREIKEVEQDTGEQSVIRDSAFKGAENFATGKMDFGRMQGNQATGWVNNLNLESTATHRHVAKVWQQKCMPLLEFREAVADSSSRHENKFVPLSEVRMSTDELGRVSLKDGRRFTPNGLKIAWDFVGLPTRVLSGLNDPKWDRHFNGVIADMFNKQVESLPSSAEKRSALLCLREVPNGEDSWEWRVRAICSPNFHPIENLVALNSVIAAIPEEGHSDALISHGHYNGDEMIANILLPDGIKERPDSDYGVGISISNSELPGRSVLIRPFLFRAICLNGTTWGKREASVSEGVVVARHNKVLDINHFYENTKTAIAVALTEGKSLLTGLDNARQVQVKNVEGFIYVAAKEAGLTAGQARLWHAGYQKTVELEETTAEVKGTLFGLINGLTRGAQKTTGFNRNDMETLGGLLLGDTLGQTVAKMRASVSQTEHYANATPSAKIDALFTGKIGSVDDSIEQATMASVLTFA